MTTKSQPFYFSTFIYFHFSLLLICFIFLFWFIHSIFFYLFFRFFYSFCFLCWFIFGKLVRLMLYLIGQHWVVLVMGRLTTLFWSFSSCGSKKSFSKHLWVLRSSSWPIFGSFGIFEALFHYFWIRWYQKSFLKVRYVD